MPKDEKSPPHSKDYLKSRKLSVKIDEFKKVREKTGGQTTGAIYKSIHKKDKNEYLIKESPSRTSITNFIASCIYKCLLGFQSVEDDLVVADKNKLYIKSKIINNLQTALDPNENEIPFDRVKNFEKIAAAKMFLYDTDIKNRNNYGSFETKDHTSYAIALDFGGISLDCLTSQYTNYTNNGFIQQYFMNDHFADACEAFSKVSPEHFKFHIKYAIDYLKLTLESIDSTAAATIIKDSLTILTELPELIKTLRTSHHFTALTEANKQLIDNAIENTNQLDTFLDNFEILINQTDVNFKEVMLDLYHTILCDKLNKGAEQMREVADLVRLDICIKTNDLKRFQKILSDNPTLLFSSTRDTSSIYSENRNVVFHLFESLEQLNTNNRDIFANAIRDTQMNCKDLQKMAERWNSVHKAEINLTSKSNNIEDTNTIEIKPTPKR